MSVRCDALKVCLFLMVSLVFTPLVDAGRTWVTTPVELNTGDGLVPVGETLSRALAMRSDATWPVIAWTNYSSPGAAMMTPVGWVGQCLCLPQQGNNEDADVQAAASPDGSVIGFVFSHGGYAELGPHGWSASDFGGAAARPALAYRRDNTPSVLHLGVLEGSTDPRLMLSTRNPNGSWAHNPVTGPHNDGYPFVGVSGTALAYDSYDKPNIAFSNSSGVWAGYQAGRNWLITPVTEDIGASVVSMAIGHGDIPHIIFTDAFGIGGQHQLYHATYNPQQNRWITDWLGTCEDWAPFSIASDHHGGIGVAFMDTSGTLIYKSTDGGPGWDTSLVVSDVVYQSKLGLAFDAYDNPVICYRGQDTLMLAYDPVMVPEPMLLTMLVGGVLWRWRRHRN